MLWDMTRFLPGALANSHYHRSTDGVLGRIDALPMINNSQIFQRGGDGADWQMWDDTNLYELAFCWQGVLRNLAPAPIVFPRTFNDVAPWGYGPSAIRLTSVTLATGAYVDEMGTVQSALEKVTLATGEVALHLTWDLNVGTFLDHEEAWFVENLLVLPRGDHSPGVRRVLSQFAPAPATEGWNEAWVPR